MHLTEREINEMLGKRPVYYIKDTDGGWYLKRKRWDREGCCLSLTWTHDRSDATPYRKELTAIEIKDRIRVDYERETVEVLQVWN